MLYVRKIFIEKNSFKIFVAYLPWWGQCAALAWRGQRATLS